MKIIAINHVDSRTEVVIPEFRWEEMYLTP